MAEWIDEAPPEQQPRSGAQRSESALNMHDCRPPARAFICKLFFLPHLTSRSSSFSASFAADRDHWKFKLGPPHPSLAARCLSEVRALQNVARTSAALGARLMDAASHLRPAAYNQSHSATQFEARNTDG